MERKETETPACSPRPRVESASALAARAAGQRRSARGPPPTPSDWWSRPLRLKGGGAGRGSGRWAHPLLPPGSASKEPKSKFQSADPQEDFLEETGAIGWRGWGAGIWDLALNSKLSHLLALSIRMCELGLDTHFLSLGFSISQKGLLRCTS